MNSRRSFLSHLVTGVAALSLPTIFVPRSSDAFRWNRTTNGQWLMIPNNKYACAPIEEKSLSLRRDRWYPNCEFYIDTYGILPDGHDPVSENYYLRRYDLVEGELISVPPYIKKWVNSDL